MTISPFLSRRIDGFYKVLSTWAILCQGGKSIFAKIFTFGPMVNSIHGITDSGPPTLR